MNVDEAYQHCERITRREARNFSYGIRLLPPPKRRALSAVYAFARRVDDIGDGCAPTEQRLAALDEVRDQLHTLPERRDDPVLVALNDAAQRMDLPLTAFDELIDGCRADVLGRSYRTFDELRWYCGCVAGSIGRLSLGVFGSDSPARDTRLADALGVALQLTNILRDVLEDRRNGRIYLPTEELERFDCTLEMDEQGRLVDDEDALIALLQYQGMRAEEWYDVGLGLLSHLDSRSRACCAAMAGIYHRLLLRMMSRPWTVLRTRTSLPDWEKAVVAARSLAGAAP
ncbi:presqualene diphosphate synthase HpnD [Gandjariella thermophila]|uniref:Squalene synthase HpnD n=1 Tax=Gandjariella thermophila TaxID=1931992 RepID=A0A4D4J3W9_9PSEU|nr:presqualene diphosphate synthase HpnD [Gandjariella thermophila]GDY28677.1 squalene synthase HpnD [Gandjariella thermophila]